MSRDRDGGNFREQYDRYNEKRSQEARRESSSDFQHCVIKHTVNGDGFYGASGDLATLKCIIDRKAERVAENATNSNRGNNNSGDKDSCIIASVNEIRYNNLFLQNNFMESLLPLYKNGGINAVNLALNDNQESDLLGEYYLNSTL